MIKIKAGPDISDEDQAANLVCDGLQKLGCPTKIKPDDIGSDKKKKGQDILGDVLGRVLVPPKVIRDDPDADDFRRRNQRRFSN